MNKQTNVDENITSLADVNKKVSYRKQIARQHSWSTV